MEKYWKNRPRAPSARSTPAANVDASSSTGVLSEFERYRRTLVAEDGDCGWESELRRYLKDMPADVTLETNIIKWWQVCLPHISSSL